MIEYYRVSVGHDNADFTGSTNKAIQAAVDTVAAMGGGTVEIGPGRYIMYDSLHLRTNVTVIGAGSETVLVKAPCVESELICTLGYGHYDVSVSEPDRFFVGSGIYISDDNAAGFYTTVATVTGKSGNELVIDRMLNHDYSNFNNGKAVSLYPVVSGCHIKNACIMDLSIDGNGSENAFLNGCRGGGIFLLQAHDIIVRNVSALNFNGDGISFQQCINTVVDDCLCANNIGHGMHPGSGSAGYKITNCVCRENGGDGIYYCLRAVYSLCEYCVIENNKGHGISIGHRDNDNIISNNTIRSNGKNGLYFRKDPASLTGNRVLISDNLFEDNCRFEGCSEIMADPFLTDVHITGNIFKPGVRVGMKSAVYLNAGTKDVVINDNKVEGCALLKYSEELFETGISCHKPVKPLFIGPEYLKKEMYAHLG